MAASLGTASEGFSMRSLRLIVIFQEVGRFLRAKAPQGCVCGCLGIALVDPTVHRFPHYLADGDLRLKARRLRRALFFSAI